MCFSTYLIFIDFPALALDIAMKEIARNGHDDERMVLVFNAFDQIVPQLGVFTPIAAALRNELFGSENIVFVMIRISGFFRKISFTVINIPLNKSGKNHRKNVNESLVSNDYRTRFSVID